LWVCPTCLPLWGRKSSDEQVASRRANRKVRAERSGECPDSQVRRPCRVARSCWQGAWIPEIPFADMHRVSAIGFADRGLSLVRLPNPSNAASGGEMPEMFGGIANQDTREGAGRRTGHSLGFRLGRSAHDAILRARNYI